ncbi:MAG: hypothetical protein JWO10_1747 [Microbacteriaceae bacterium]|nr:hypothetical protein [Microbacteriaceae bacterium]
MSTAAYSFPAGVPREAEEHPRHIEIVSTRGQRRARPRVFYAIVGVGGLFVILMAQLLLSILLSQGAYQISALQASQKELSRDQQTLTESLQVLQSPQNLATRAGQLGMVMNNSNRGWLRLSDGAVLNSAGAAGDGSAVGGGLVGNVLLTPELTAAPLQPATTAPAVPGAPAATTAAGSVPSNPGAVPSPITR